MSTFSWFFIFASARIKKDAYELREKPEGVQNFEVVDLCHLQLVVLSLKPFDFFSKGLQEAESDCVADLGVHRKNFSKPVYQKSHRVVSAPGDILDVCAEAKVSPFEDFLV